MRAMALWIVLTDDWELRGNGTGRVEDLQQKPATRLMDLYQRLGVPATFNVEVLQQLAFERYADGSESIARGRDAWIATVRRMVERGFDVQLHLHPQWADAELIDGWWKLGRRWSIADYAPDAIRRMLDDALNYLAPIIAPHKPVSFRGGSWGIGPPSREILTALSERGIKLDVSIVNGVRYDGEGIKLDYTRLDSPHFPYRPDLDDARRVAAAPAAAAPLVEIPTQAVSRRDLALRLASDLTTAQRGAALRALGQLARGSSAAMRGKTAAGRLLRLGGTRSDAPAFVMRDPFGFLSGRAKTDVIFDLSSGYDALVFQRMADICIERARARPNGDLTVLMFENHTKDLQADADFRRIEALIAHIRTRHPDVEFHTLSATADAMARLT
jgi:hypothetical protein